MSIGGPAPEPLGTRVRVHFWTRTDSVGVDVWDPDAEPGRFPHGVGHGVLELSARLRQRGWPVTVGKRVQPGSTVVVAHVADLYHHSGGRLRRAQVVLARDVLRTGARLVVIRGDRPFQCEAPAYTSVQVWPNPTSAHRFRGAWLPLLPQRGIVPRDTGSGNRLETVALYANPANVPSWVQSETFTSGMGALGMRLVLHDRPETWHDFSDTDVVLCVRGRDDGWPPDDDERILRKPPTKLVNAWVAGSIPLVQPEQAYLDLVRLGHDALLVRSEQNVLEALAQLSDDPGLVGRLLGASVERGREFSTDRVLRLWTDLLASDLGPSRRLSAAATIVASVARWAARPRLAYVVVRRKVKVWAMSRQAS